jgi:hypothetical protein
MNPSERLVEPANYRQPRSMRAGLCAVAVYVFWALLLIAQKPGLQYDEALHVIGAVHMLHDRGELTLPHDPDTWACVRGRCIPLMSLRYTGAVKEYLCLPLFAAVGPRMSVIRLTSMLLGAFGIWGLYVLCREQLGSRMAAAAAFLLAINPSYINQTVFDNSAVGLWMGAFGFLCLLLSRYLRQPTNTGALLLGFAAGFAVWTRANFLWLIGAVVFAALLVMGRRLVPPLSHIARMAAGAVIGAAPFLVYQILSKGGTWEALGMYAARGTLLERIHGRLVLLSETLLSDREHRAMWAAAGMPAWQAWLLLSAVVLGCCVCLLPRAHGDAVRRAWERVAALSFLILTVVLLTSRLDVSEHHLVVLLPIAALVVVLAGSALSGYGRLAKGFLAALLCTYGCLAFSWNQRAFAGLAETGGVGLWSDAAIPLTEHIEKTYPGKEIKILDWGLQNNLFVLSGGRVRSQELFWDASAQQGGPNRTWSKELNEGGIYLLPGPSWRSFPEAAKGFLAALDAGKVTARRFAIAQRSGDLYAQIVEVQEGGCSGPAPASRITTGDPRCAAQLDGFHQIEEEGWRWSSKKFAATLGMPARRQAGGLQLILSFYLPDTLIRKLGPVTLTARLGGGVIARQVYSQPGARQLAARLDGVILDPRRNTFQFELDKCVGPTPDDKRQLGLIVSSIAINAVE